MSLNHKLFDLFYQRCDHSFALVIYAIEMVGGDIRVSVIVSREQVESIHGDAHPGSSVDPRCDHKSDIVLSEMVLHDAQLIEQSLQTLPRALAQDLQAVVREHAVLSDERHHVRHGRDADEIEE